MRRGSAQVKGWLPAAAASMFLFAAFAAALVFVVFALPVAIVAGALLRARRPLAEARPERPGGAVYEGEFRVLD